MAKKHNLVRNSAASISIVFGLLCSISAAAKDYNRLGKVGFAHWRCAAIGGLSQNKVDQEQAGVLFISGHKMLSEFVTDVVAGKVKDEDTKEVPIGIKWYLTSGPSIEFRMGFMWAQFSKDANDDTWPKLEEPNFDAQRNIQKMDAMNKFRSGNCHLL